MMTGSGLRTQYMPGAPGTNGPDGAPKPPGAPQPPTTSMDGSPGTTTATPVPKTPPPAAPPSPVNDPNAPWRNAANIHVGAFTAAQLRSDPSLLTRLTPDQLARFNYYNQRTDFTVPGAANPVNPIAHAHYTPPTPTQPPVPTPAQPGSQPGSQPSSTPGQTGQGSGAVGQQSGGGGTDPMQPGAGTQQPGTQPQQPQQPGATTSTTPGYPPGIPGPGQPGYDATSNSPIDPMTGQPRTQFWDAANHRFVDARGNPVGGSGGTQSAGPVSATDPMANPTQQPPVQQPTQQPTQQPVQPVQQPATPSPYTGRSGNVQQLGTRGQYGGIPPQQVIQARLARMARQTARRNGTLPTKPLPNSSTPPGTKKMKKPRNGG